MQERKGDSKSERKITNSKFIWREKKIKTERECDRERKRDN